MFKIILAVPVAVVFTIIVFCLKRPVSQFEAEGLNSISQDSRSSSSLATILERECGRNKEPARQISEHIISVLEYSAEQVNVDDNACGEEPESGAVTHDQMTEVNKGRAIANWLVNSLLVVILIGTVAVHVHFAITPAGTRANKGKSVSSKLQDLWVKVWQPRNLPRDLSTPSSRLVGHWIGVPYGGRLFYPPIDRSLDYGTFTWIPMWDGVVKFNVLSESRSGNYLTTREFLESDFSMESLNVEYCISKDGQSMTREITTESGSRCLFKYRYVDNLSHPTKYNHSFIFL